MQAMLTANFTNVTQDLKNISPLYYFQGVSQALFDDVTRHFPYPSDFPNLVCVCVCGVESPIKF